MRDSVLLPSEGCALVLDIHLGGVSGAIVKNGNIVHVVHHTALVPQENIVIALLQKTESLLQKTVEDIVPKQKITKTYIFIDAPLSYGELGELVFQKEDKSFLDKTFKEIEGTLDLPQSYQALLGNHTFDGVVIEHPPVNHTIHGYPTSNMGLVGERKAFVTQQWIQRSVYVAVQEIKRSYELGEIVFLSPFIRSEKNTSLFFLGDIVSTLVLGNKNIFIGAGTRVAIAKCADTHVQPVPYIESVLKSVARSHGIKDPLYKTVLNYYTHATLTALKQEGFVDDKGYSCAYVGDVYMFPVIEDTFSSFKNIHFAEKNFGPNARLSYIIKNKVQ